MVLAGVVSTSKTAGRGDYRDILKGIEFEEVGIAGDNEAGFAIHGKFEKFVVAGIAVRADCVDDWDYLGDTAEEI